MKSFTTVRTEDLPRIQKEMKTLPGVYFISGYPFDSFPDRNTGIEYSRIGVESTDAGGSFRNHQILDRFIDNLNQQHEKAEQERLAEIEYRKTFKYKLKTFFNKLFN